MTTSPEAVPFGEAIARLEAIVNQLESNEELGLEQSLALYEEGVRLAGECHARIASARLRLNEVPASPPAGADDPLPPGEPSTLP